MLSNSPDKIFIIIYAFIVTTNRVRQYPVTIISPAMVHVLPILQERYMRLVHVYRVMELDPDPQLSDSKS